MKRVFLFIAKKIDPNRLGFQPSRAYFRVSKRAFLQISTI
jgi:hypothetical protein